MKYLNSVLKKNPSRKKIKNLFRYNSYIKLNTLYINPISLLYLKNKLTAKFKLRNMYFTTNSLVFKFITVDIVFQGTIKIIEKKSKIYCLELDFDATIKNKDEIVIIQEIEIMLKKLDLIFFLSYKYNFDSELLNNSLFYNVDLLNSILEKNDDDEKAYYL